MTDAKAVAREVMRDERSDFWLSDREAHGVEQMMIRAVERGIEIGRATSGSGSGS